MKRIFKIEMKRAFLNRMFAASLLIGLAVCTIQIFAEVLPMQQYQQSLTQSDIYPHGVFSKWIGGGNSYWGVLYFALLPILAALPFADSLHADRRSGYVKNIFTRGKRRSYYTAKFISVFLSGGAAAVLPLLWNLYLSAMLLPSIMPDPAAGTFWPKAASLWAEQFYTQPYLYTAIFCAMIFIVSGLLATVALAATFFVKYRFVVLLVPFIVYQLITFLSRFVSDIGLDMQQWLMPQQYFPIEPVKAGAEVLLLALIVLGIYCVRVKKDETY